MPWRNINDLAKNNLIHINFKKQYSALYCDYDCTWLSQGHGYWTVVIFHVRFYCFYLIDFDRFICYHFSI